MQPLFNPIHLRRSYPVKAKEAHRSVVSEQNAALQPSTEQRFRKRVIPAAWSSVERFKMNLHMHQKNRPGTVGEQLSSEM